MERGGEEGKGRESLFHLCEGHLLQSCYSETLTVQTVNVIYLLVKVVTNMGA